MGAILGTPVDEARLIHSIEAHSFEAVTGRERGSESSGDFARKGIAGDWRNVFTRESAEVFEAYAGDVLIRCGYEADNVWVSRCSG